MAADQHSTQSGLIRLCRFCGFQEHVARQFVNGCEQHDEGHDYVEVNADHVGPVGPGTPAARMRWLWDQLRDYEDVLVAWGGYNPVSSRSTIEMAILQTLAGLKDQRS